MPISAETNYHTQTETLPKAILVESNSTSIRLHIHEFTNNYIL